MPEEWDAGIGWELILRSYGAVQVPKGSEAVSGTLMSQQYTHTPYRIRRGQIFVFVSGKSKTATGQGETNVGLRISYIVHRICLTNCADMVY